MPEYAEDQQTFFAAVGDLANGFSFTIHKFFPTPKGVYEKYTIWCIGGWIAITQLYDEILKRKQESREAHLFIVIMEFKNEELVEREIEIAGYLTHDLSLNGIAAKTGLNKKILIAHIRNMMKKLKAADMDELIKLIRARG